MAANDEPMIEQSTIPTPVPSIAPSAPPIIVAIDMGYGHLRPARSLATLLGGEVLHADRAPLADLEEQRRWGNLRRVYESISRISGLPWIGPPLRTVLNTATHIPHLHPFRDLSVRTLGVKLLERSGREGLGQTMVAYLQERDATLL